MAWHYGTFSCGHDGRVDIIGPTKDRQRKADWHFSRKCEDCRETERLKKIEKVNKLAAERAAEMELPRLKGTEKQIAWANTIRDEFVKSYEKAQERMDKIKREKPELYEENKEPIEHEIRTANFIMEERVDSSYWIDNRDHKFSQFVHSELDNVPKTEKEIIEKEVEEQLSRQVRSESTIFPENKVKDAPVEIRVTTNSVQAVYERDYDLIEVAKSLGYKWSGKVWEKRITEFTGSAEERAAELGNELLNNGFPVVIINEKIRNKAIKGNFKPECTRWVRVIVESSQLAISWSGYDNKLYDKARSLPKSKWNNPSVLVHVAHFKEVKDFADAYGFEFSKAAKRAIEEHKRVLKQSDPVTAAEVSKKEKDGLEQILKSDDGILDDLKED